MIDFKNDIIDVVEQWIDDTIIDDLEIMDDNTLNHVIREVGKRYAEEDFKKEAMEGGQQTYLAGLINDKQAELVKTRNYKDPVLGYNKVRSICLASDEYKSFLNGLNIQKRFRNKLKLLLSDLKAIRGKRIGASQREIAELKAGIGES